MAIKDGIIRVSKVQAIGFDSKFTQQISVSFVPFIDDTLERKCSYYVPEQFELYLNYEKPANLILNCDTQQQLDYLIDCVSNIAVKVELLLKNTCFDLTCLERLKVLKEIYLRSNSKVTKLWDVRQNKNLKYFSLVNYNRVADFSCFENSSIECLQLFGCNHLSSFKSKLHIERFDFLLKMSKLRRLHIDIVKDNPDEYNLNILSQLQNLEKLYIPDTFFTFNQFAWLSSKLPNVKEGLACYFHFEKDEDVGSDEFYSIIGKNTPKHLKNNQRAREYFQRYETLIRQYKTRSDPPRDDEV